MTGPDDLNWTTLSLVKRHLYRRLATPLNHALGRLAIARHVSDPVEMKEQVVRAEESLEVALNLIKAWAVLVHVKSGGTIRQEQRRPIAPDGLPAWLVDHLNGLSAFQAGQTRPVFVQAETFYESLVLMSLVGSRVGSLKKLLMADALDDDQCVSVRAIFEPPSSGPYASLGALFKRFSTPSPADQETGFQIQILQELFRLNGATLRLQNNQRSGEQSLAARLRVTTFADEVSDMVTSQARAAASSHEIPETTLNQLLRPEQRVTAPAGAHVIENESDTLIVPPVGFHERLAELLDMPTADLEAENKSDTLIVPPPNFRERLAELSGVLSASRSDPETGAFDRPPESGMIERIEPENASDTLIVPPPDYQRRLTRPAAPPEPPSTPERGDQNRTAPTG